jgi:hypothetical protein
MSALSLRTMMSAAAAGAPIAASRQQPMRALKW